VSTSADLHALVARVLDAVLARSPAAIWAAAKKLDGYIALERKGKPARVGAPRELWKRAADFVAVIRARGPVAERLALPLLAAIDADAALPGFRDFVGGDWSGIDPSSDDGQLLIGLSEPWHALSARIPPDEMVALWRANRVRLGGLTEAQLPAIPHDELVAHLRAYDFTAGDGEEVERIFGALAARASHATLASLWLAGRAPIEHVPDAALAGVSLDALVTAVCDDVIDYLHVDDARRFCAAHPGLRGLPECLALLERTGDADTHAANAISQHLVRVLARHGHAAAIPTLRRLRAAKEQGEGGAFTDALFALGDRETLEGIAAQLGAIAKRVKPRWDPHHTLPELRESIRATFALHRERATEAFAPYFTPAAVRSEKGAKIALDVLLLGQGIVFDHGGSVLRTGDVAWLALDPRWGDVLAALAKHPRLGPRVRSLRKAYPPKDAPAPADRPARRAGAAGGRRPRARSGQGRGRGRAGRA
jgi:hypothetical protein